MLCTDIRVGILLLTFCHNFSLLFWHVGHHHDHVHDSAVTSVSIVSEGLLDLDEVKLLGLAKIVVKNSLEIYYSWEFILSLLSF